MFKMHPIEFKILPTVFKISPTVFKIHLTMFKIANYKFIESYLPQFSFCSISLVFRFFNISTPKSYVSNYWGQFTKSP